MPDLKDVQITMEQAEEEMACYRKIYDIVRLLDREILEKEPCAPPWKDEHPCIRCISREALMDRCQKSKLETTKDEVYYATSRYVEIDGRPSVIEMVKILDMRPNTELVNDKLIYTDPLTGAYNRRYYEDKLRYKSLKAGVAMIDLDDFKLSNDTYGHQAGDKVLKTVVSIIRKNIRGTDLLVRYGGDELLLILPDIGWEDFVRKLNVIRRNIGKSNVPEYERIRLSVSIGGVLSAGVTIEESVRQADKRMYQAKRQKDTVVTNDERLEMTSHGSERQTILIVDDSEMNRELLKAILRDSFEIIEAANGRECIELMEADSCKVTLVLLDIVMPDMDGFEVLGWMNNNNLLEEIPVIMISNEDSTNVVRRAYELGAADYISRPFDARVVRQRVSNTTRLYAKQRRLSTMVAQQFYEREKNDRIMIGILSHVTAMHNGEDSDHIRRVQILTSILLERLAQKTDRYALSAEERSRIVNGAALHDIGKMAVDSSILRKQEALTPEEKQKLRQHPMLGVRILNHLGEYRDEPLVNTAREICHWHHERYDGTGYPDRLEGEEIPISAQVVGVADAYDGLRAGRSEHPALEYTEAIEKICDGSCGKFNPLLLECLTESQNRIKDELEAFYPVQAWKSNW